MMPAGIPSSTGPAALDVRLQASEDGVAPGTKKERREMSTPSQVLAATDGSAALRSRRIAVIGGGSAYMPGVIRGLLHRTADLQDTQLALYDIDQEHAELMARLGNRMAEARGASLAVTANESAEAAVTGSDFVFTSFRPGGLASRHLDETLPLAHGLVGQETVGPGGLFMSFRSIPILLELASLRDRLAPEAWIINYTNPTSIVTGAVVRHGSGRILGLCDQSAADTSLWASILDIEGAELEADWVGTNHATAATRVRIGGKDATDFITQRLAALDPRGMSDARSRHLAWLGENLGVLVNSYLRYYFFHDEIVLSLRESSQTRAQQIAEFLPGLYEDFRQQADKRAPDPSRRRGGGDHGEFAIDVMCAIAGDEKRRFIINTVNNGAISGLPDEAIVEVPCTVGSAGATPLPMGAIPRPVRGLIEAIAAYEDLAVDAATAGDRGLALQALLAHPFTRDASAAEALLDDALGAHQEHLPQFSSRIAGR